MTATFPLHEVTEGTTGRTILLCRPGLNTDSPDPDPEVTWSRGITLLAVDPPPPPFPPPATGQAEAADTLADAVAAVLGKSASGRIGVVAWSTGGVAALALAARHPALVDRLVLIATPAGADLGFDLATVTAKTLLLYGAKDQAAGPKDGKWYQQRLPDSRYEQVPEEGPLLLERMWPRTLSHLAPRLRRSTS